MNSLLNVDWQITSNCNRHCLYCFGPQNIRSMSFQDICLSIDKLKKTGVKQIGITGGEPLLHPHITSVINYIYDAGISIYLSTNCDYYYKYSDLIKSKVSIIGIPIDGPTPEIHDYHRGDSSFLSVMNVLDDINNSKCNTKIKVGTVVTKMNCFHLKSIEQLLAPYNNIILYWKLYQLIAYERNLENVNALRPAATITEGLGYLLGKEKVINDTLSERNRGYFFIKPNGDVFIPILSENGSKEETIGNILHESIDALTSKFFSMVDDDKYLSPYRYMQNKAKEKTTNGKPE